MKLIDEHTNEWYESIEPDWPKELHGQKELDVDTLDKSDGLDKAG